MMLMSFKKLHFQTKVIRFGNVFVYNQDINMMIEKIEETNVSLSNKWQVYNTMPLVHLLSLSAREPLWKISHKKVRNVLTNEEVYQFKVSCVSYPNLKQNQAFKEKIGKYLSTQINGKTSAHIGKTLKNESTCAISLIML